MDQRNLPCTSQMIDLEMDRQGQRYLHPEACTHLGGITNFRQPDIQTMIAASGNMTNIDGHNVPECFDSAVFCGMPQYHGVQHRPHHYSPNLDLDVAIAPSIYVPCMTISSGIPLSHGSCDQLPSSSSYGVVGISADEYGTNSHFMDNARGCYKRKNAEGNPGNFQYLNASASSSSSVAPLNTRHPDGVALIDSTSLNLPQYRGSSTPSIAGVGSHKTARNRLGAPGLDPVLTHNRNQFIQGNYMGQPLQPAGSLWSDQGSSSSSVAGASAWTQTPATPYIYRSNVNGCSMENGNMVPQRFHEPASNRSNPNFVVPSPVNLWHHNFNLLSPPIQGLRGHNINVFPQVPAASFRVPANYTSQNSMNPYQDGLNIGPRHPPSVQPTGLRMYRPHHEAAVPETTLRHHILPRLRVLPTDGVAVLDFPDYYEVENFVDHHGDMRLDIEDMSYEELLALGERIGNVNTGLSEKTIRNQLKMRTYLPSSMSINLEEVACSDQEPDSCVICQDDYRSREKIGTLDCGHEYHADCVQKWLRLKNVCPICKSEALATERNDA